MIDLRAARQASGMTQREIAHELGMGVKSGRVTVAQIEGRSDWLVSSLAAYFAAIGADVELIVNVNDQELRFSL